MGGCGCGGCFGVVVSLRLQDETQERCLREDFGGVAVAAVDESFGLFIAVC